MICFRATAVWMFVFTAILLVTRARADESDSFPAIDVEFFETKIRPVLAEHCFRCHSASSKSVKAGLRVDSRAALLVGGDSGPAIEPGDTESLLLAAIRYEEYEMPPKGKLPDSVIADFVTWIEHSAAWPVEVEPTANEPEANAFDLELRKTSHWAWQPIIAELPPTIDGADASLSGIDRFIFARLKSAGLAPAKPVDRASLARRLAFDLVGLPPSPEDVAEYVNDPALDATERMVDRLLQSPHFGERWGRHWLDLVRYAESRGHEFDADTPSAYQYRDYVIRALNGDVPYDQFVREHIAGDLLRKPRLNPESGFNESILGTGFWFLGEWVHSPVDIRKDEADRFDNMIDCMSKTFLALTVSCARCHDHKFDAISTEDYYSLSGFLQSSHFRQVRFETLESDRQITSELSTVDAKFRSRLEAAIGDDAFLKKFTNTTEVKPSTSQLTIVLDYTNPNSSKTRRLYPDGFAYSDRPIPAGQWVVENFQGEQRVTRTSYGSVRNDPFWDVIATEADTIVNNRQSDSVVARGRGVRTPTFKIVGGIVSLQVRGRGTIFACVDSHRLVAGPLHGETILQVKEQEKESACWVSLNLHRYKGHGVQLELVPAEGAILELIRVVDSGQALDDDARVAFALPTDIEPLADDLKEIKNEWITTRNALQAKLITRSHLAMAMMDGSGEDDHLLIRGNASSPGPLIPRHFLTALNAEPLRDPSLSGRLELAERITDPANPLYARVIVNRVWHHLLGRGIVPTVDDFGMLGQRPTHPELLDYLANWFLEDGQSIKRLIRHIVLTRTYQMSGETTPEANEKDPKNSLYHHRQPKRLEAEIIRDSLLAVSGELNSTMYGESIPVYLTNFMDGRGRPSTSGPADGDRRRSIYLGVRRNFISPFTLAFDTPVPFSTMGRRTVSNVPAQALILMNNPFVMDQAKAWAQRLIDAEPNDVAKRIVLMYQTAFARSPLPSEANAIAAFAGIARGTTSEGGNKLQTWTDITHAIINSKEFIFVP